jgi:prepilin signal peptidase PulO-like enzyme (type II secretory pathway)
VSRLLQRPAAGDLWLELGTAVVCGSLALRWGLGPTLGVHILFAMILLVILAIDLRHRVVYVVLGYGGLVTALAAGPLTMSGGLAGAAAGGAVGAAVFGALYLGGRLLYPGGEPLATGDVTIAALLGAIVGYPAVQTALVLGILAGGVDALAVLARGAGVTRPCRTVRPSALAVS